MQPFAQTQKCEDNAVISLAFAFRCWANFGQASKGARRGIGIQFGCFMETTDSDLSAVPGLSIEDWQHLP